MYRATFFAPEFHLFISHHKTILQLYMTKPSISSVTSHQSDSFLSDNFKLRLQTNVCMVPAKHLGICSAHWPNGFNFLIVYMIIVKYT